MYINDFCYYRNCLYTHRYKFSFEKKKKGKESQCMVSLPGICSDSPIGSDRESGRDTLALHCVVGVGKDSVMLGVGKDSEHGT